MFDKMVEGNLIRKQRKLKVKQIEKNLYRKPYAAHFGHLIGYEHDI